MSLRLRSKEHGVFLLPLHCARRLWFQTRESASVNHRGCVSALAEHSFSNPVLVCGILGSVEWFPGRQPGKYFSSRTSQTMFIRRLVTLRIVRFPGVFKNRNSKYSSGKIIDSVRMSNPKEKGFESNLPDNDTNQN